jgi:hypothetical protein
MPERFINGMWSFLQCLRRRKWRSSAHLGGFPSEPRYQQGYTLFENMFDYTGGWIGSG